MENPALPASQRPGFPTAPTNQLISPVNSAVVLCNARSHPHQSSRSRAFAIHIGFFPRELNAAKKAGGNLSIRSTALSATNFSFNQNWLRKNQHVSPLIP